MQGNKKKNGGNDNFSNRIGGKPKEWKDSDGTHPEDRSEQQKNGIRVGINYDLQKSNKRGETGDGAKGASGSQKKKKNDRRVCSMIVIN